MNAFPTAGTVDPWPEILHLLPQKVAFKGAVIAGSPEQIQGFARWLIQQMPAVVGSGDPESKANCFLMWLRSETRYEADEATRMQQQAQVQQAPQNPISDQTVAQQAQPVAAPVAAPAADAPAAEGGGLTCPECGATLKNLTGMKRHCTMTHKADWSAIAQKHGLDITTGLKLNGAPVAAAPVSPSAPPPPPPAAAVPPMFGAQGQASQAPPSFVAPPPPPAGQTTISFGQMPQFAQQQSVAAPAMQQMPAPPAQVAAAPIAPLSGPSGPAFVPPSFGTPPPPPAQGPLVSFNPNTPTSPIGPSGPLVPSFAPPQQFAQAQPQQAAPVAIGAPTREGMAQMLGGAVDLVVVRLLDAAAIKLDGRSDVNQLALLAEQRAKQEQKVVDLAQSAYGAGKQAAQRHFADLLTQHPNCYLLQNGYEPILPGGYLEILAGRVTKFHIVTDAGRQTTTIFG